MSIRFSLALLLLVALSQLLQQVEGNRRKICGSNLSAALDLICVDGFSHAIGSKFDSLTTSSCNPLTLNLTLS